MNKRSVKYTKGEFIYGVIILLILVMGSNGKHIPIPSFFQEI